MKPRGELRGRAARLARLLPSGPTGKSQAARTPFVLLVVLLLGGGLITLLMLNSALNEGSFRLNDLKKRTTDLTEDEQALQRDVDAYAAPDALQRRARKLGMVPGGDPAFLKPDGTVGGVPSQAAAAPVAPRPTPTPTPTPTATPTRAAGTSPAPSGSPTATPATPATIPAASGQPKAPTPTPTSSQVKPAPSTTGR
ncbi:septum formation initiator [Streptomyces sp. NPDC046821]|uniref:septum formation initiator n=1 Tax=Streptomyces sp. NPDC046821 TaxID=3154702 RepID=UPI0033E6C7E5